jgi:pimeloyl-ACP methyl ester carboxylesterase
MNLVLLPGFMTDETLWDDMAADLRRPGSVTHGDLTQDDSIPAMAQRVLSAAPLRFVPVGFSMGGYVAREIARMAPERTIALVLIATSARGDSPEQARRKLDTVRRIAGRGFHGLSRVAIAGSVHPDRAKDAKLTGRIADMGKRLGGQVMARQYRPRDSDLDRLHEITCPTLVIAAAQDRLRSLAEAQELRDGIPGAVLQVIDGSGHMLPMEQPRELARIILSWLRERDVS